MLEEFWHYFMATGQVDMYLNYKAYEEAYQDSSPKSVLPEVK